MIFISKKNREIDLGRIFIPPNNIEVVLTIRNHLLWKLLHQLMLLIHHENVHQVQQELQVLHDFVQIIYLEQVQQFH